MWYLTSRESDAGGGGDAGDGRDGGVVQANVVAEERQDDPQGHRRQTENLYVLWWVIWLFILRNNCNFIHKSYFLAGFRVVERIQLSSRPEIITYWYEQ